MPALNQTRAYFIVREGRTFEINPINLLTQLYGATVNKICYGFL